MVHLKRWSQARSGLHIKKISVLSDDDMSIVHLNAMGVCMTALRRYFKDTASMLIAVSGVKVYMKQATE